MNRLAYDAERTFLHDLLRRVHFPRTIGTGPGAEAAAHAIGLIDQHDAVFFAFIACAGWADGDAGRVFTMQARFWEMDELCWAILWLYLI